MEQNKMTPIPWAPFKARSGPNNKVTVSGIFSASNNSFIVLGNLEDIDPRTVMKDGDVSAVVTAVNSTYGSGINPESIPDLKKCLEELLAQFEKVVEPKYTLDYMLIRESKAAIEKSTIKP